MSGHNGMFAGQTGHIIVFSKSATIHCWAPQKFTLTITSTVKSQVRFVYFLLDFVHFFDRMTESGVFFRRVVYNKILILKQMCFALSCIFSFLCPCRLLFLQAEFTEQNAHHPWP